MKVLKVFPLICILGLLVAGCSKPVVASLSVLSSSLSVEAAGGPQEVSFLTNQDWSVRSDADWLTVTPTSGGPSENYQTLIVSALENPDEAPRTATLTIVAGEKSAREETLNQISIRLQVDMRMHPSRPGVSFRSM